jgi:DNA-binding GntR family transcriptional regulator
VDEMEGAEGDTWSDANYAFHLELYRIAAMPHYATTAARVLTLIEPTSRVAVNRLEGRPIAQAEHVEMIAALRRRDADALAEVLERHSTRARALLVQHAEELPVPDVADTATAAAARAFAERLLGVAKNGGAP